VAVQLIEYIFWLNVQPYHRDPYGLPSRYEAACRVKNGLAHGITIEGGEV
jgi:hypothetical protein